MILIPYFFSSMFLLVCAFKKDGFEGVTGGKLAFYRGIGIVGFFYSIFPDLRGRPYGSHDHDHSVCAGHCFVLVWPEKERNEAFLPKTLDKVVAAAIVAFFVISIVCIATGTISVI